MGWSNSNLNHEDNGVGLRRTRQRKSNWNVVVVLTAQDVTNPKIGDGAYVMENVKKILAQGGVTGLLEVMAWQRAERQDQTLSGRRLL
jgi:hypothetical protein